MPVIPTYPGVYIEEIPSGVRTIMGVSTSVTAFIGRALRGPADKPVVIHSFGDYERQFGGLWGESTMSFAVRDFFLNGGSDAVIVRLFDPTFIDEDIRSAVFTAAETEAQAAADAVFQAGDAIATTPGDVADACENAVDTAAQSPIGIAGARAVLRAALDSVPGAGSAQDVADAAGTQFTQTALEAETAGNIIKSACEAAETAGLTIEEVAQAGKNAIPAASAAGPVALLAAEGVAQAAADAVPGAANPSDIVTAATSAVPVLKASVEAGMTIVINAANAAAGTPGATPQDVADEVWKAYAGIYAARIAAEIVAKAARDAVTATASLSDVKTAAQNAIPGAVSFAANTVAPVSKARLTIDGLTLEAVNEGSWGNTLRARVDHDVKGPEQAIMFNLHIKDGSRGVVESIRNVTIDATHKRRVDNVLKKESRLVRVFGSLPPNKPQESSTPPPGDLWDDTHSTKVSVPATDGNPLSTENYLGSELNKKGIYALADTDIFNLLCIPPYTFQEDVAFSVWSVAAAYCEKRRAVLIVDSPSGWLSKEDAINGMNAGVGTTSKNAVIYFPRLRQPNILKDNQMETFVPCGAVAGVIARTDSDRGVWKAPAGLETRLRGVPGLSVSLTDAENGELNPRGLNCLRVKVPAGRIVWGARTFQGDDRLASEWKYLPVRRTALYIEESLYRGTQWVVFEPNDEKLWGQIRLSAGSFMQRMFTQGAFKGQSPKNAYFVKCDSETTTEDDINRGVVNILVGFAPLKPAEFVIIKLQQLAGQGEA